MDPKLIAPCGMNCSLCVAYLREKNKCPGCKVVDTNKPITRLRCKIKNCEVAKENHWKRCSSKCGVFPCDKLQHLDKRYRTKYGMSMIDNLNNIEKEGIKGFIEMEKKKWINGNRIFCVHDKKYYEINKGSEVS
jgi:hypothetical protein